LVDRSTCCKSERSSEDSRKGSSAVNMLPYIMETAHVTLIYVTDH
jgi:hypothetical protein